MQQHSSAAADQRRHHHDHHHHHDPPDFFSQYFPQGLKVLLVGTDNATQTSIQRQLRPPHYHITHAANGSSALQHLQDKDSSSYDLVLSEFLLQDMEGDKFISDQLSKTSIPHVVICGRDDEGSGVKSLKAAFECGVCYVLWKPVNECELGNLWQHVCKKREQQETEFFNAEVDDGNHHNQNHQLLVRRRSSPRDEGSSSLLVAPSSNHSERCPKKPRTVWNFELHQKFLVALNQLGGADKAVPKAILERMNMGNSMTREIVASHLQKYRIFLKRKAENERENQNAMMLASGGPGESSHGRFIGNNNINTSVQPIRALHHHPDMGAFQPPPPPHQYYNNNNNNIQLREPSVNNSHPPLHITDEEAAFFSQAHHSHHSNQPHNGDHHDDDHIALAQMQMQLPPQQNLSGFVVPLSSLPPSAHVGNIGSSMQQQQISQNPASVSYVTSGNSYGSNVQITQSLSTSGGMQHPDLASSSYHGGNNMHDHQGQKLAASGSFHGNNTKQLVQGLASNNSYGSKLQRAMQHLDTASGSFHGGNSMQQHQDQTLPSGSFLQQQHYQDPNLVSYSFHGGNNMQNHHQDPNLIASFHGGNNMQNHHQDPNLSGSFHGGNSMHHHHQDPNLSGSFHGGNNMQHHYQDPNLNGSFHGGNNMQQHHQDQTLDSSCLHGGNNMQHYQDPNLGSGYVTSATRGGNNDDGTLNPEEAALEIRDYGGDEFCRHFGANHFDEANPNFMDEPNLSRFAYLVKYENNSPNPDDHNGDN